MIKIRLHKKKSGQSFSILKVYSISCLLFFALSVFCIYRFKVYDIGALIIFYIYEGILWLGIKAGGIRFHIRSSSMGRINKRTEPYSFSVNRQGQIIISFIYIAAMLSFIYFLVLYRGSFKIASFGSSIKAEYDDVARTKLEVITQFILYAGSAVYLIVIGSKSNVSNFTSRMARLCLFLPGLRGALLGRRFTLAVEALIFFFVEYDSISIKVSWMNRKRKKTIRRIVIIFFIVVIMLLYIFSRRIVYSPDMLFVAYEGDTILKPFWKDVYSRVGSQMNILSYVSYYAGHVPYAFSYAYANIFSYVPFFWGLQTGRVFIQIVTSAFDLSPSYAELARQVPGIARYTGYAGTVISDFGKYFAPFISFLFGFVFSRIECGRRTSCICYCLYPIVQVACAFAPVYFFFVGVLDHVAFWVIILSPLCLTRCNLERTNMALLQSEHLKCLKS